MYDDVPSLLFLLLGLGAVSLVSGEPIDTIGLTDLKDNVSFVNAFISSISMIFVSEIGDKTFIIAAIMSMKYNRMQIFAAAFSALAVMTILSAALGYALPNLLSKVLTHYVACLLFATFGFKLLYDVAMGVSESSVDEELEEVEKELDKKEVGDVSLDADPNLINYYSKLRKSVLSPIFIQAFTMTFLAEWGDRSQISTIALAAAKHPVGVTLGGCIGHAICTGGAVMGGRLLSQKISPRNVNIAGGILFLLFALHGVYAGPE